MSTTEGPTYTSPAQQAAAKAMKEEPAQKRAQIQVETR